MKKDAPHIGPKSLTPEGLARAFNPPHDDTAEELHGVTVYDPFRPLEQLDAPDTVAWTKREDAAAAAFISQGKAAEDEALAFFEKYGQPQGMFESMPAKYGDKYIVWRKEQDAARPSLYIKDVPDYGAPARLLLDPLAIDPSGKTTISWVNATEDGKTLAYALNKSGSDVATLKFLDVATGENLDLTYPTFPTNVNHSIKWDKDGQGFHYNVSNPETKSSAVYHHKMGTPVSADKNVYDPQTAETGADLVRLGDNEYVSRFVAINVDECDRNAVLVRRAGSDEPFREIFPLKEGLLTPLHEKDGVFYAMTNLHSPNGRLVAIDLKDPAPAKWRDILPEDAADPLKDVTVWHDKIYATYSHDTGQMLRVFDMDGTHLHDAPIPPLSNFTLGQMHKDSTTCLISCDSFQEAGSIYKYDADANTLTLHKKSSMPTDLKDCIVERVYATSKDGTKVPMTVIRAPETKLDGSAATILYGYGGFNVPLNPAFNVSIAQWVRAGGIYVQANLRGGGEFGQKWYDAGRLANKENVFDDAAACAEHLIKNNYTSHERIALQGGSNGGLLALATMVKYPKMFGAVVAEVPVADMFRFHIGSYEGFSWKSDYGNPDVKEDFNVNANYSPLHRVEEGFQHPPLLIKTDAHDDRVLPWHSFKMAATLQSLEDPSSLTLLKVRHDGGHAAGMSLKQRFADISLVRGFLSLTLGPINQNDYKAKMAAKKTAKKRTHSGPKR